MPRVARLTVDLYGSLAETGRGHGTDIGIQFGLSGEAPDTVEPSDIHIITARIKTSENLLLWREHAIPFDPDNALSYRIRPMVEHPNSMRFSAFDKQRQTGADMHSKYKETSRGGLAVNVVVC